MEELIKMIEDALAGAKSDKRACWRDDIEEKAYHNGEINAYNYTLHAIKKVKAEQQ